MTILHYIIILKNIYIEEGCGYRRGVAGVLKFKQYIDGARALNLGPDCKRGSCTFLS